MIGKILERSEGCFLDIGANVGQTLLDFLSTGAARRYVGFEPNPASFISTQLIIEDNQLANAIVLPIGLAEQTGVLTLYSHPGVATDQGATLIADLRPTRDLRQTAIVCFRFDALRASLDTAQIGLAKIDVEGAELEVLRGMEQTLRDGRPPVLCEILDADSEADFTRHAERFGELNAFTRSIGYEIFRVEKSPDETALLGISKMRELPLRVWKKETGHECDYLLLASEKRALFEGLFPAGTPV